jgi:hypothetical protein
MATKKTSTFTLTERLQLGTAGAVVGATIDLGSYIDVAARQGLEILAVDYIVQGTTAGQDLSSLFGADAEIMAQVLDLNRSGFAFANDRALVSSMRLLYDSNAGVHMDADMFPDNYGSGGSAGGRIVVNDQLYVEGSVSALAGSQTANVSVRVQARIVSLSAKDFMAIAIQSTAADN